MRRGMGPFEQNRACQHAVLSFEWLEPRFPTVVAVFEFKPTRRRMIRHVCPGKYRHLYSR